MKTWMQLLLITVLIAALASASSANKVEPQVGLIAQVVLEPSPDSPNQMKVIAKITAPGSGELLFEPTITLLKGDQGEAWTQTANGETVHFLVDLNEEQSKLTFLVELTHGAHGESIISSQETTIHMNF
jgi:hypothetical protein